MSEIEFKKFTNDLQNKKKEWIVLSEFNNNQIQIRNEQISAFEILAEKKTKTTDGTIPIKALADFAKIHPVRITRNLAGTLATTGGNERQFRRATKETAIALFEMLSASGETSKKKSDFLKLFGE